jgi:hypothetical protein
MAVEYCVHAILTVSKRDDANASEEIKRQAITSASVGANMLSVSARGRNAAAKKQFRFSGCWDSLLTAGCQEPHAIVWLTGVRRLLAVF